jgi:tRNA (guanine10-N2)-dimethyltransferase
MMVPSEKCTDASKMVSLCCSVSEMDITGFAKDAGFRIIDEYSQRVHRSLTRRITLLYKEK